MTRKWLILYLVLAIITTACLAIPPASTVTSIPTGVPTMTPPLTGDFEKGPVYISSSDLLIMESFPVQVALHITGDLPTPCHRFQAEVAKPDAENRIEVTAYSLANPELMCAQVLQPFEESVPIPMDGAPDGTYSVWLNGEEVGEFTYPG